MRTIYIMGLCGALSLITILGMAQNMPNGVLGRVQTTPKIRTESQMLTAKVREARQYMLGYMKEYNPQKGFALYLECAQSGSAVAMNALGSLYMSGTGVAQNDTLGVEWFEKAALAGYAPAWNNLGQAYHYARGVPQDFQKEYACYQKIDTPRGWYNLGYLHYKGFGCAQDYVKAVEYFRKAAQMGYGSAQYFLGLCYRNGYGVARNMQKGDSLVALGRDHLVIQAQQELDSPAPENSLSPSTLKSVIEGSGTTNKAAVQQSLSSYHRVKHDLKSHPLAGEYTGYLIRYDWSGQIAIDQSALKVTLTQSGNRIQGEWLDGGKKVATISGTITDTALIFDQGQYLRTTHYQPNEGMTHQLKQAVLDLVYSDSAIYLAGNVQMFLPGVMEPAKPMYLTLKSTTQNQAIPVVQTDKEQPMLNPEGSQAVEEFRAYPNPFEHQVTVGFTLREGGDITLQVFSVSGQPVYSTRKTAMAEGRHTESVSITGPAGPYIIRLAHKGKTSTTMVIKK